MVGELQELGRRALFAAIAWAALSATAAPVETSAALPTTRDGTHDFDFHLGLWHTHIHRALDPFDPKTTSIELNGRLTVDKVWGGRAQIEQIEADGPQGHWQAMTLFIYNPQAHQWSQSYLNSKNPTLGNPLIGSFQGGRGELFSADTFKDRAILVRGSWSNITPNTCRYEEFYSDDGGGTWHQAFRADLTRDTQSAGTASSTAPASPAHDFDFDFGSWHTHSTRLVHPLTGDKNWMEMDGTTVVRTIWNGQANLAEYKAEGPAGTVELLSLRWYNPTTRQWSVDFATPGVGTLGIPAVGEFRNGRADFYDYEPINGHYVLVRFSIWGITPETAQSEQAFSADGGKTWEVNWINKYTRATAAPGAAPNR